MKSTKVLAILIMLTLPMAASAENVVVPLPTAEPQVQIHVTQTDEYTIDLESYFNGDMEGNPVAQYDADGNCVGSVNWEQYPSLNKAERARVPDLLARYANGERPQANVLDKTENVVVAVYALDPAQYQGENVFVLIPGRELTDEELLEIIDGYAQLGLTFDADGFSWRNCMRGGGIECTRGWAGDESERYQTIAELYRRQGLRPETPFTSSPSDDGMGEVTLNADEYSGLDSYRFWPARRMTDNELLQVASVWQKIDAEAGDYNANEQLARRQLSKLLGAPLALELGYEDFCNANQSNVYNEDLPVYNSQFNAPDGTYYFVLIDTADGTLYNATAYCKMEQYAYSDLHLDPFDERWLELARQYIAAMRTDGMPIATLESHGEIDIQYGGYGVKVLAVMEDGSSYELSILFQNDALYSVEYRRKAVTQEQIANYYGECYNR